MRLGREGYALLDGNTVLLVKVKKKLFDIISSQECLVRSTKSSIHLVTADLSPGVLCVLLKLDKL